MALAVYHWQHVTAFGWTYLVIEIIIVLCIARFEWHTANTLNTN
jgi:hypothetical protein